MTRLLVPITILAALFGFLALDLPPCDSPCPPMPTVYDGGEDTGDTVTVDQPKSGGSTIVIDNNKTAMWVATPPQAADTGSWDADVDAMSNLGDQCTNNMCYLPPEEPPPSPSMPSASPAVNIEVTKALLFSLARMDEVGDGPDPDKGDGRHPDPHWHEADPYWHTDEYPWTPEDDWRNLHYYRPDWNVGGPTEPDIDTGYTDDDHNRWGDAVYNDPSNGDEIEPEHHADDDSRHDSDCADCPPSGPEAQVRPGSGWLDERCDADSG